MAAADRPAPPPGTPGQAAAFQALQPGVQRASTVLFPDMAHFRARDWTSKTAGIYGTHGTPTTFELEARIARLEGGEHSLLCPSGQAAIALTYLALLKPGDELLVPVNVYPSNRQLVLNELREFGIQVRLFDPTRPDTLSFSDATRLAWIEAPCSLSFEFPDVPALAARCREHGVLTALDSTWSAGIAFSPFALGVDLSVHSLSKFAAGSGEVVMGSVTSRDKTLYDLLKLCAMRLGQAVSPADAALVISGLDTLALRYHAQDQATRQLVAALAAEAGGVYRVLHPAAADSVGHALWQRDCVAAAGLFSLVFDARFDAAAVDRFIDALALFRIGFGWGGPRSLVVPQGREVASVAPLEGELVRFAVGLEAPERLLADLRQALQRLG